MANPISLTIEASQTKKDIVEAVGAVSDGVITIDIDADQNPQNVVSQIEKLKEFYLEQVVKP